MNLLEAIHARRAVRAYDRRKVDEATIRSLLRAAVEAPSAMNLQPWRFVVVQNVAQLRRYSDRAKGMMLERAASDPKAQRYEALMRDPQFSIFYDASTLVVIATDTRGPYTDADAWLAAENLMLAACDAGLGSCPIGFAVPMLNTPEVKGELCIAKDGWAVAPIIVGYPAGPAAPVPRNEPVVLSWST